VRGFDLGNNGLLTPTLSSFGEEREKNEAVRDTSRQRHIHQVQIRTLLVHKKR
jgi:hypothetical protein